ncbi:MAG: ribbon-helix-helix domain-containing protein [Thermodesulfobacteriota bacterium]
MPAERKSYNTTLRTDLVKKLRILAAHLEKRQNELVEEAIQDLLKKHVKQVQTANKAQKAKKLERAEKTV